MTKKLTWEFFEYPILVSPKTGDTLSLNSGLGSHGGASAMGIFNGRLYAWFLGIPAKSNDVLVYSTEVWSSLDGISWGYDHTVPDKFMNFPAGASPPIDYGDHAIASAPRAQQMADGRMIIPLISNYFGVGVLIWDGTTYTCPMPTEPGEPGGLLINQGDSLTALTPNATQYQLLFGFPRPSRNEYIFGLWWVLGNPLLHVLSVNTDGVFALQASNDPIFQAYLISQNGAAIGSVFDPINEVCFLTPCYRTNGTTSAVYANPPIGVTRDGLHFSTLTPPQPPYTAADLANNIAIWTLALFYDRKLLIAWIQNSPNVNAVASTAYGAAALVSGAWEVCDTPGYADIYNFPAGGISCAPCAMGISSSNTASAMCAQNANAVLLAGRLFYFDPLAEDANGNFLYGALTAPADPLVTKVGYATTRNFVLNKRQMAYFQRLGMIRLIQEYL